MKFLAPVEQLCIKTPLIKLCVRCWHKEMISSCTRHIFPERKKTRYRRRCHDDMVDKVQNSESMMIGAPRCWLLLLLHNVEFFSILSSLICWVFFNFVLTNLSFFFNFVLTNFFFQFCPHWFVVVAKPKQSIFVYYRGSSNSGDSNSAVSLYHG